MQLAKIGIALRGADAGSTLRLIQAAEAANIPNAWLTTGGAGPDGLTIFAAAAATTQRITLGTAITPTYPRHPVALVQQANVVATLAPGRFVLGIGGSHGPTIETAFGLPMGKPLDHLREYLRVARAAQSGAINHRGEYYQVSITVPEPREFPIMISALRRNAFHLAGEVADGAISWLCPPAYLEQVALPAMRDGAAAANRPTPTLVAHAVVARTTDQNAVRDGIMANFRGYPRLPFYQRMFADAGFPEALQGEFSDAMINAIVAWGSDDHIRQHLRRLQNLGDVSVLVSPLALGSQSTAAAAAGLFDLLASLA